MVLKNDIIEQTASYLWTLQNAIPSFNSHFKQYENIFADKQIVLLAAGPSLNDYNPIPNAIHIGVNKLAIYKKVELDFYFTGDLLAIKRYQILEDIQKLKCQKFIGLSFLNQGFDTFSPQLCKELGAKRFFHMSYNDPDFIPTDISSSPLIGMSSIIFPALHFALFTGSKKIYLVGCDCSNQGHFIGNENVGKPFDINPSKLIQEWIYMKNFIELRYPQVQVLSINPVGLKGIFNHF